MSEGRFSGSGEIDERVPADMGDDWGSSSTTTSPDARAQLIWGVVQYFWGPGLLGYLR